MTWSEDTWEGFCALFEEAWPGEFHDSTRQAWRLLLDSVDPDAAAQGLRRLLYSGRKFYPRPSVADLLAAVREDPSRPAFEEMLLLARSVLLARPRYQGHAVTAEEEHQARQERLSGLHPLVQSFVARQGLDRLGSLPLDDPEWGPKNRKELREAWDRHVETFDGREIAVLASGGRTDLRQLDPLSSLGVARPQLPGGEQSPTEGASP